MIAGNTINNKLQNMRKLHKYTEKSELMNVRIKLGTELFKFNLYEELKVDENIINDEIGSQSTIQAFLGTLFTKLDRIKMDKEREMEKTFAELFVRYKGEVDSVLARYPSDDLTKQKVIKTKKYQEAYKAYIQARENLNIIKTCVESFDQRAFLMQTLSANIRKSNS